MKHHVTRKWAPTSVLCLAQFYCDISFAQMEAGTRNLQLPDFCNWRHAVHRSDSSPALKKKLSMNEHILNLVIPSQFIGNFSDSLIMQLISTPMIENKQLPNKYENSVDTTTICDEWLLGFPNKSDSAIHFAIQLAMNCFRFASCSAAGRNLIYTETESQFDSIDGKYIPDSYKKTASFARKAMEKTFYHTEFSQPSSAVCSAH